MMISPEMFVELHKDKKYKDLLPVRDELINAIRAFDETNENVYKAVDFMLSPEGQKIVEESGYIPIC